MWRLSGRALAQPTEMYGQAVGSESCPRDTAVPCDQDISGWRTGFRGLICRDGLGGGSTESPQPCWGLKKGGQLEGA